MEEIIKKCLQYFVMKCRVALSSRIEDITPNEIENILKPMYYDNWQEKHVINHIKSVRDFNRKNNLKEYANDEK